MYLTEDDLAWFWAALCLAALAGVIAHGLRRRADRQAEWARIKREPLAYAAMLAVVASVAAVLVWIVTDGRLLGAWTLWCALGVGAAIVLGNDLQIRWQRRRPPQ